MSDSSRALISLFVAVALTVGVAVAALGAALIQAQRRRRALQLTWAQRLLAAQEEERARVARDVHDDALQRVVMIRHEVEALVRASPAPPAEPDLRKKLDAIATEVADLGVTLRGVAHELHPSLIGDVGLSRALDALAADFARTDGLAVTLHVPDDEVTLAPDAALSLYRIAQESLRNVVKHAGVHEADLTLGSQDGLVRLVVSDRGRGFGGRDPKRDTSLGLTSMKERAGIAGGRLRVESVPGRGTSVEVLVPPGGRGVARARTGNA